MKSEEEKFERRIHGPQFDPDKEDSICVRLCRHSTGLQCLLSRHFEFGMDR